MPMELKVFGEKSTTSRDGVLGLANDACTLGFEARMGEFVTSTRKSGVPNPMPCLWTTGAATCVIIAVQCKDGTGSLGHLFGVISARAVVLAVKKMLTTLGDPVSSKNLDAVVLAAGAFNEDVWGEDGKVAKHIEAPDVHDAVVKELSEHVGTDSGVKWKKQLEYSACIFIPQKFQIAFWKEAEWKLSSMMFKREGVARYNYS